MSLPEEFKHLFQFIDRFEIEGLDLKALHEHTVRAVTLAFLKYGDSGPPLWLIGDSKTGKVEFIVTPWHDERQKRIVLAVLREAMRSLGYDLFSTASEVWFAEVKPDTDPEIAKLSPSKREDAKEALIVCSRAKAGGGLFTTHIVTRLPGRNPGLGQRNDNAGDSFAGRMWDLFEDDWDPSGSLEKVKARAGI